MAQEEGTIQLERYTNDAKQMVAGAQQLADERQHAEVTPLHLLVRMVGNGRGVVTLHARHFEGLRRGVLVSEGIWPNASFADGNGINTLTGSDPVAPYGGAAFHDNRVWIEAA